MTCSPHETGPVDLRFAKAYLPVCAIISELILVTVLVLVSWTARIESWAIALVAVWFLKRVVVEQILQYNSLLETATAVGILTQHRSARLGETTLQEKTVTALWLMCFCTVNIVLALMWHHGRHRNAPIRAAMWVCIFALVLYSVYTPLNDAISSGDIVKTFLFVILSVVWVYVYESHELRYDRAHDCEECKLRFIAVLFVPTLFSLLLMLGFVAASVYYHLFHHGSLARDIAGREKRAVELETIAEMEAGQAEAGEDHEIFRLAMQTRESEYKSA